MWVKISESQVLAKWCKTQWKSRNINTASLHIDSKYVDVNVFMYIL